MPILICGQEARDTYCRVVDFDSVETVTREIDNSSNKIFWSLLQDVTIGPTPASVQTINFKHEIKYNNKIPVTFEHLTTERIFMCGQLEANATKPLSVIFTQSSNIIVDIFVFGQVPFLPQK